MIIQAIFDDKDYQIDLSNPIDISIPLTHGEDNPNCYYAANPNFETIEVGDFVGSVERGGTVNYQRIHITPHGNGTHTEVYGHITADSKATISNNVNCIHDFAEVISLTPQIVNNDRVLLFDEFENKRQTKSSTLIIRTIPNPQDKKARRYSETNPPYLDHKIAEYLCQTGIKHLLIDLPSVDKEVDGGELKSHRAFWNTNENPRTASTITELIYVPNEIIDGLYFLNLQIINLNTDACPSRPVLFRLIEQ